MPIDLVAFFRHQCVALGQGEVGVDHFTDQCVERDLRRPAELRANLARVAEQGFDFGGPEITRIHPYDRMPRGSSRSSNARRAWRRRRGSADKTGWFRAVGSAAP